MKNKRWIDWLFRFVKGAFIGSGAILPGVSGGALAAVFGIYERMIAFLANITKDFKKNILFFLPVGLGGLFGVFLLSFAISYFFETAESQIVWFFIGCILGTLPSLFKQAGKHGRKPKHFVIMFVTAAAAYLLLFNGEKMMSGSIPLNFGTWIMAGVIFGLGAVVPGLSPSNFLVYLNMYKPMTDGIKSLDFMIILPLVLGVAITVITLSKLMSFLFKKAYAGLYHFILGVVLASTIMIVPSVFKFTSLFICVLGIALGLWMSSLEERYKPEA